MNMTKKIIIILLLFVLTIPSVSSIPDITISTNSATNITTSGATFSGNITSLLSSFPQTVWFEWSKSSTHYMYSTPNQTMNANGTFSKAISGMPIMANTQYFYRACTNTICGSQQSFTTSALGEIPDYNFDAHYNELVSAELNPTNMSAVGASAFTDRISNIFWGILFAAIFLIMWIRQEDVTIPSLVGMIIGGSLWALVPADWVSMAMSLTVVSFAGLVYSLLKGRS